MNANNLCQFLGWDTDFFGKRIARVSLNRLNESNIRAIDKWCHANKIDCLYFLASADDGDTIWLVEENGFHLVDIRVTFKQHIDGNSVRNENSSGIVIRPSSNNDVPALRLIAKVGFRITRFYYDPYFPEELCDALYETWIEKSCKGYSDIVLVAENQIGHPIGFISCNINGQTQGEIGLVGVSPDWQGIGLGQELIHEALCWFLDKGISKVMVVTQGRNSQAQRLYQRCGFLTDNIQIWYHKWFSK